jgi:hypothetical protein
MFIRASTLTEVAIDVVVLVAVGGANGVGVLVGNGVGELVDVGVGVTVSVGESVSVSIGGKVLAKVDVKVPVGGSGVEVLVGVGVAVGVWVAVNAGIEVGDGVGVTVGSSFAPGSKNTNTPSRISIIPRAAITFCLAEDNFITIIGVSTLPAIPRRTKRAPITLKTMGNVSPVIISLIILYLPPTNDLLRS